MAQDPYRYFRVEARELIDQLGKGLLDLERDGPADDLVPRLLRIAHTLKGAARVVKQPAIADRSHAIEDALTPYRGAGGAVPRESISRILALLDEIGAGVAELSAPEEPRPAGEAKRPAEDVLARTVGTEVEEIDTLLEGVTEVSARLGALRRASESIERARHLSELLVGQLAPRGGREAAPSDVIRADRTHAMADELRGIVAGLERNLDTAYDRMGRELQQVREVAEQMRLAPAGQLVNGLERTARDAAETLDKRVAVTVKGAAVRLDAHVLRIAQEALTQIVRNAVAHGIEPRAERRRAGKAETGRVAIEVIRRGRRIVFRCSDDGRGLDLAAVRAAGLRRGLPESELARLDVKGLLGLLLRGGISTSTAVTEVAGRGIGMDVVRSAVERLGGEVDVQTTPGIGTTFELNVPLSLASIDCLLVESGGRTLTVPLDAVRHTQRLSLSDISHSAHGDSIVFDGKAVPFVWLANTLDRARERAADDMSVVVVTSPSGLAAVGVDRLRGIANLVLRSLPEFAPAGPVVAGASLDAEGNPLLVLDTEGLVAEAHRHAALGDGSAAPVKPPVLVVDDSLTTRMLEQSILESAGYEVDLAVSAEDALEVARRKRYALFLVDVEMPGMDGFSFIERIRRDPLLRDTPAILVSSRASQEDFQRGRDVGAQGYMVKSEFDQAQLLARIRELAG